MVYVCPIIKHEYIFFVINSKLPRIDGSEPRYIKNLFFKRYPPVDKSHANLLKITKAPEGIPRRRNCSFPLRLELVLSLTRTKRRQIHTPMRFPAEADSRTSLLPTMCSHPPHTL